MNRSVINFHYKAPQLKFPSCILCCGRTNEVHPIEDLPSATIEHAHIEDQDSLVAPGSSSSSSSEEDESDARPVIERDVEEFDIA